MGHGGKRDDVEAGGIWVPPAVPHESGGGKGDHLPRCLYFGFLQAQLRPGTDPEGGQVRYEYVPLVVC